MADVIERVEAYPMLLPYGGEVQFHSVHESAGPYILLRLMTRDSAEGIAESVVRPQQFSGEDPQIIKYQIETFFRPLLKGVNPLEHNRILVSLGRYKGNRVAKMLIDVALWDLKGKLLGKPVWSLLGGGPVKPVPVSAIVFGDTAKAQAEFAARKVTEKGVRGLKIKMWKKSMEDIAMVGAIRAAVGDDVMLYGDANSAYSEREARNFLARLGEFNVALMEDPCKVTTVDRMAALARDLPMPVMGDAGCENLEAVHGFIKANAIGAVSVKLRRTGITESLKIIGLCEAANIPAIIGTDTESRIGAMARLHIRAALPYLEPWPSETQFFEQLTDDAFDGELEIKNGLIAVPDKPGFGASINLKRLKKLSA